MMTAANDSDQQYLVYKYVKKSDNDHDSVGLKFFSKQKDAIKSALSSSNLDLRVFAFQISPICRRFLVANIKEFWDKYKTEDEKHFYEVIISDKNANVKLFLDLEYHRHVNQDKDGDNMTNSLISLIDNHLQQFYNISDASQNVIILDSSDDRKFSKHVTFQTAQFSNIKECGEFVDQVLSIMSDSDRGLFEVKSETGDQVKLFVDQSVYTTNRHLRLYLSSKFGQTRPLLCVRKAEMFPGKSEEEQDWMVFQQSLAVNTSQDVATLRLSNNSGKEEIHNRELVKSAAVGVVQSSPYKNIDEIVKGLIAPGRIRKIVLKDDSTIRYDIAGFKFCSKKGGEHSNSIYFKYFIRTNRLIQDCYSPSCTGAKEIPII